MPTTFLIVDPQNEMQVEIDFSEFIGIVQGASVYSGAASDNSRAVDGFDHSDFIEFGLTDAINLRIQASREGQLTAFLMSTLNRGDVPPIRLQLTSGSEAPSAALVEERIRALRQSYAMARLVEMDQVDRVQELLAADPYADLESLLPEEERLYVSAAGPGSLWLTLASKSAAAYKTLKYAVALPFKDGREALLRRVEADTRVAEINADQKQLELSLKKMKGLVDTLNSIEKVKDPEGRKLLKEAYIGNLQKLGVPDTLFLPPRKKE